LKTIK
jgi:hypothetical protein